MNNKSNRPIPDKEIPPHCPFNHTACIETRCVFWVSLSGTQSNPIDGAEQRVSEYLCAFHALLKMGLFMLNKPTAPNESLPSGRGLHLPFGKG